MPQALSASTRWSGQADAQQPSPLVYGGSASQIALDGDPRVLAPAALSGTPGFVWMTDFHEAQLVLMLWPAEINETAHL